MAALSVGLTGGIGSGKSEVAWLLASYGAVVIDADQLAREVVAPDTEGLAELVAEFGGGILRSDGALDREKLAEIVFAEPAKRERLNAIVHPKVGERAGELQEAAPDDAIVVYDVPLLVENGLADAYDAVVVVDATVDSQVDRLARSRNMPAQQARARIDAQAGREQRRAAADVVIDNDGPRTALEPQVHALWERLKSKAVQAGNQMY